MAISKIILNGVTQIDLTSDTVAASNLIAPNTAHGADGEAIVGTATSGSGITINDVSNATGTTAEIVSGGGSSHFEEGFYQKFYPSQTYTDSNKLSLQLEASENCIIFVHSTQYPTAPSTGYKALFWNYCIYKYDSSHTITRTETAILRANGTEGTDSMQCVYYSSTGILQIGGPYGYFFPEDEYEVIQIIMP